MAADAARDAAIVHDVERWLVRAVIGLNLCPFARSVHVKRQIAYRVSHATEPEAVLADLSLAFDTLEAADPAAIDTLLLIVPEGFDDFLAFNDMAALAERLLKRLRLRGVFQIATFHPDYQFAGAGPDDIENYTNRAPYPILHLLREESVTRAVDGFPDPDSIYERNQARLRALGHRGWRDLMDAPDDGEDGAGRGGPLKPAS
ncbi:DUF1415 domain-containing protein [Schauerella aestuarii]|uniref:DUF1415 domain-containing protein n=1 Tax=Schauerella aestuarii TaxID=2511204 RepID=UPI0013698689|nr:DUF1415 domain-containing protein [Achromobacter aestuarii]MYZ45068.1 DUF1415 domain-containing protein [Achromobacter aestuarii]